MRLVAGGPRGGTSRSNKSEGRGSGSDESSSTPSLLAVKYLSSKVA